MIEQDGAASAAGVHAGEDSPGNASELMASARKTTDELKARAGDAARRARQRTEEEAEKQAQELASHAAALARAMRTAGDQLRRDGQRWMADYIGVAADGIDRMTGYLHDRDPQAMTRDLEKLGRDNPAMFLGSAFAGGVALGRFLRASRTGNESRATDDGASRRDFGMAEEKFTPNYEGFSEGGHHGQH